MNKVMSLSYAIFLTIVFLPGFVSAGSLTYDQNQDCPAVCTVDGESSAKCQEKCLEAISTCETRKAQKCKQVSQECFTFYGDCYRGVMKVYHEQLKYEFKD